MRVDKDYVEEFILAIRDGEGVTIVWDDDMTSDRFYLSVPNPYYYEGSSQLPLLVIEAIR